MPQTLEYSPQEIKMYLTMYTAYYGELTDMMSDNDKNQAIENIKKVFVDFMLEYVKTRHSQKESYRMMAGLRFKGTGQIKKFPELPNLFLESYNAFLSKIKTNLTI